ncbi:MAG: cell division protein FtsW [Candidatus Aminicenantes bacterium]|nr:cell division protein FtsW [Candidatus Aminicenantes bacterium]
MDLVRPYGFDRTLFYAVLVLLTLGVVMVFSTSGVLASEKYHQPFHFLFQQAAGSVLGLALIIGLLPLKRPLYENAALVNVFLAAVVGLLVLCFAMPTVAGTNRWVILGGLHFQPSEFAKVAVILHLAWFVDRKRAKIREARQIILPLGILSLVAILILREPDFGTGVLVFVLGLIVLFIGGMKIKHLSGLILVAAPVLTVFLLSAPYRIERLMGFLAPGQAGADVTFQVEQSKLALGAGGLFGVDFGRSTQKLYFLPCAHTDFIFAIIGEEFGLLGTVLILGLFLLVVYRGLAISRKAPSLQSQLIAAGLSLHLGIQAFLNMTVVLGLGPCKGVPLPLVSFGRSSLLTNLLAVGILLHISQRQRSLRPKP